MRQALVTMFGLGLLAACGSSAVDGVATGSGTVELVLTDAGLDEVAQFEVDVASITFHRLDGADVAVLPRAVRVDFAELRELGELVGRGELGAGRYTGVAIGLDFAAAEAVIVGATAPAAIVDATGAPLTGTVTIDVQFPTANRPAVRPGHDHIAQLDLDLNQAVDVDAAANVVTFRPVVDVTFDPSAPRAVVVRGELGAVDTGASQFVVQRLARDGADLDVVTVAVASSTVIQVSGDVTRGANGLAWLAALPADARVFVEGTYDTTAHVVRARAVEAGLGVRGGTLDVVDGWIVARDGGRGGDATLTVLGRSFDVATGTRQWFGEFQVTVVHAGTKVLERGTEIPSSTDALQVGTHVHVFGALDGTDLDAGPAASGIVRVVPVTLRGRANAPPANDVLALEIARIDALSIDRFDFRVAGATELDPGTATLDVRSFDVAAVATGDPVAATGFFGPVGVRIDEDFTPFRIATDVPAGELFRCVFDPAVVDVLVVDTTAVTVRIDTARAARIHDALGSRPIPTSPSPRLVPATDDGAWRILERSVLTVHRSFATFAADLDTRLARRARVASVRALGRADAAGSVFTAVAIGVELE